MLALEASAEHEVCAHIVADGTCMVVGRNLCTVQPVTNARSVRCSVAGVDAGWVLCTFMLCRCGTI